jgi:hypothetical protein
MANLAYQLLALDPAEKTRCENAASLLYLLRGFTMLWNVPKVTESTCTITDGATTLGVVAVEDKSGARLAAGDELGRAYIVTLSGPFGEVEPRREPLAAFLKAQDFELLYVLRDQVSEEIACKLYPHLYQIENQLRGYLIRFMATRIGPKWWELTASSEMADKAKMRKKNERVFGKHIENSAYLIDFDELGEIVYEQSSGFLTREDILGRISGLPETPDAIRALKQELRSNYHKLFKEAFADKDFKEKWTQFESLRNKIAHNNLFTADDLSLGERLATEIKAILTAADAEAAKLVITHEEREAIQEQVIARRAEWQDIFLNELELQERQYHSKKNGFVGLKRFVSFHLRSKGYSYKSSQAALESLRNANRIQVYYVENPFDGANPTAAIRRFNVKPE